MEKSDLFNDVVNRPSAFSSIEARKYRARFQADRETQTLNLEDARTLSECLVDKKNMMNWDEARLELGKVAIRHLGLVDHAISSVDWFFYGEMTKIIRKIKPWVINSGPRVHVFKIVRVWICSPQQLIDENEDQHIPITPHEARLSNSAYEALVVVDLAQWVYVHPKGLTLNAYQRGTGPPGGRYTLPDGWASWPLETCTVHLRKPLHKICTMSMCWIDRRATGTLKPHAWAFEEKLEEGGSYPCTNSYTAMPLHETLEHNHIYTFVGPGGSHLTGNDGCETPDEKEPFALRLKKAIIGARLHMGKAHRIEIRCCHPTKRMKSTSTIVIKMGKYKRNDKFNKKINLGGQQITVQMQFLSVSLPPTVIFKALGFSLEQSIQLQISVAGDHWYEEAFAPIIRKTIERHPPEVKTEEDALIYIAEKAEKKSWPNDKKILYGKTFLQNEFGPHIGLSPAYNKDKALWFAKILHKLYMKSVGFAFYESKDHYVHQRYDTNGTMWGSLLRQLAHKIHSVADRALRGALANQSSFNWKQLLGEAKSSEAMLCCVSKGSWSVNRFHANSARTGATIALKTTNYWTYASAVRRANTANKAHRRAMNARQIDETQYGRLCAVETPEGEMCGIARYLALGANISTPSSTKALLAILIELVPKRMWVWSSVLNHMKYLIDLDGRLVWRTSDPQFVIGLIRKMRRSVGLISPYVGVHMDGNTIYIRTSPGRNVRLLIVLSKWLQWLKTSKEEKPMIHSFTEALQLGILEFIDAMEERSLSIAFSFDDYLRRSCMGETFSHMEVDPSWMLGVTCGSLPLSDHNQAPRSVLASSMTKQTFAGVMNPYRLNTTQHILEYPMKAIASTMVMDYFHLKNYCTGHPIPFVVVSTDHSIEDSWDLNQAALERGMHRTSLMRRYVAANKPLSGSGRVERFEKPGRDCIGIQDANHDKIQADGLPLVGTLIETDDIIIGRTYREAKPASSSTLNHQYNDQSNNMKHDDSISVRDERGIVQSVRSISAESYLIKEVNVLTTCLNEIGDKYWFRHGQKGTTGINRPEADCYTSVVTGRTVCAHMNPIGILARMTDGLVTELHKSTASAIYGQFTNATPFQSDAQKSKEVDVIATLLAVGAQKLCYETFINGMTGEMTAPMLTGICYMSPLAHLVGNKIHARNRGPRKLLTRQPDDGRSKHGGLRFGQMEVDCFIASGAAWSVVERLKKSSDGVDVPVCSKCGLLGEMCRTTGYKFCRTCYSSEHVSIINISYSNKLFLQELTALHIKPALVLAPQTADIEESETAKHFVSEKPKNVDGKKKVTSYYDLTLLPEPEPWEWEKYGIKPPMNLRQRIGELSTAASEEALESIKPKPGQSKGFKGKKK